MYNIFTEMHRRKPLCTYSKLFFTTKSIIILLFVSFLHMSANAQQKISLTIKEAPLEQVFTLLRQQTNYNFLYDADDLNNANKVTLSVKGASLSEILNKCFQDQPLTYIINDKNTVVIKRKPLSSNQKTQPRTVGGKVTNEKNQPIAGVTVSVKNARTSVVTNKNGAYQIVLPGQTATLVYSMVGYMQEERTVDTANVINVMLNVSVGELDQVVVVGFGTQRRASVVGAITTIDPKELKIGTSRSMSNNLAGQLAGVIGIQRSGEPGYDNSNFWIRGISTFGGNRNPLVLVDGVERSLDNMDPEEIESFSILKDAAASAVYGVRGANGVILINTKRGKVSKPNVSLKYEQGFTQPIQLPDFVDAATYLEIMNNIREERGENGLYTQERIDNIRNRVDPDLYPDVNWLDAILKDKAANSRANMTVSGGSNILRYSLVSSYYGEQGLIERDPNQAWDSSSKLQRFNVRSNVDINITPSTLFRLNIGGYMQDRQRAPQSVDDLFQQAFTIPPFVHPTVYSSGEIPRTPERTNPWALATQRGYERFSASKLESLFSLEQDLGFVIPGLKARGLFSFDRYSNTSVTRSKDPDYYNPATGRDQDGNLKLVIDRYGQQFLGYSTGSDWGDKSTYVEGTLFYNKAIGNHNIESMFLYNMRNYDNGSILPFRNQGIAGRFSYNYNNRYIAEFNFGYNGSENFARGKRFGFFPSVALGWYLSEEPFMERFRGTFSKIKFRGSYGLVGNDNLDGRRFAYITTIGETGGYRWGINNDFSRTGRREGDLGNPNLTWETVAKSNVGIELGLWNTIELQMDFFKELRSDIFMQRRSIPGSSGFVSIPWANYGKVENRGIDMSVNVSKQLSKDFFLSVRGTLTYAANRILEQDEPSAIIGTSRSSTGKPIGQLFGLVADGLFTEGDFTNVGGGQLAPQVPKHTFGPVRPGDIKYKDLNGDGLINTLDRTAIGGTEDPQLIYGAGANLRYKAFEFGFFFQAIGKTDRVIGGANFIPGSGNGSLGNIYANVHDRWTVDNPRQDVFYPRLSDYQSANNNEASTWWLRDMSLIRLRNIEVGYNLPQNLMNRVGVRNLRLFLRGNNLLTISEFKLWDPELGVNNGLRYPVMKSVSFGVEINFK